MNWPRIGGAALGYIAWALFIALLSGSGSVAPSPLGVVALYGLALLHALPWIGLARSSGHRRPVLRAGLHAAVSALLAGPVLYIVSNTLLR